MNYKDIKVVNNIIIENQNVILILEVNVVASIIVDY